MMQCTLYYELQYKYYHQLFFHSRYILGLAIIEKGQLSVILTVDKFYSIILKNVNMTVNQPKCKNHQCETEAAILSSAKRNAYIKIVQYRKKDFVFIL